MNISDIISFLREDSPYSTMRIAVLFIVFVFFPCFVFTWVKISLSINALAIIPESVQWLIGIVLGAKTAQKVVEVIPKIVEAFKNTSTPEGQDVSTDVPQKTDIPK